MCCLPMHGADAGERNACNSRHVLTAVGAMLAVLEGVIPSIHGYVLNVWVDKWARGTPVKRGDPRYFVVSEGEDAAEQKKER